MGKIIDIENNRRIIKNDLSPTPTLRMMMMMRRRMIIMLIMMRRRYLAELNAMPESMLIMRIRMIGMLIMIMS